MKMVNIQVPCYEKGDYVLTTDGFGIVIENQEIKEGGLFCFTEVLIQHYSCNSNNPNNEPVLVSIKAFDLVSKEEYDKFCPKEDKQ